MAARPKNLPRFTWPNRFPALFVTVVTLCRRIRGKNAADSDKAAETAEIRAFRRFSGGEGVLRALGYLTLKILKELGPDSGLGDGPQFAVANVSAGELDGGGLGKPNRCLPLSLQQNKPVENPSRPG